MHKDENSSIDLNSPLHRALLEQSIESNRGAIVIAYLFIAVGGFSVGFILGLVF